MIMWKIVRASMALVIYILKIKMEKSHIESVINKQRLK